MLRWGQANNGESCNVLQSGLTRSLVAKFLLHSVVASSTWILCCRGRMLRTKPQTGMYKPDVTAPKACQNNCSYVIYMYLRITMHGGRHWAVTQRTLKNQKAVKIGVWVLACPGQYGIQESIISFIGKFIQLAHKVRGENIHGCRGVCLVNGEMVVALIPHEG